MPPKTPKTPSRLQESITSPSAIFGVLVLIGFVVFGLFLKAGLSDISVLTNAQGITVSGTAQRSVTSDRGSIAINLSTTSLDSTDALAITELSASRDMVITYLQTLGIQAADIEVQTFVMYPQCTLRDKENWDSCIGKTYNEYNQTITAASNDVTIVKDLSLNLNTKIATALPAFSEKVKLSVAATQYFYTKFDSVKAELLNEATKNAFERAEAIASSTNNHAGAVITASQGVFQVTSKDSVDTSDYGYYDTSAIDKKISAVVRVSFKVR